MIEKTIDKLKEQYCVDKIYEEMSQKGNNIDVVG
jgi:hypothetical protein